MNELALLDHLEARPCFKDLWAVLAMLRICVLCLKSVIFQDVSRKKERALSGLHGDSIGHSVLHACCLLLNAADG